MAPSHRFAVAAGLLAAAVAFLIAWWTNPKRPTGLSPSDGWWSGYDQNHYLLSALAFAHLDFAPASHWYLPLYPALAALFVHLLPADPFMVPDLACLLASVWLSSELGAALSPRWRFGRLAGLAGFLGCAVAPPVALQAWVMPWSSTLAVPLILSCLLATLAGLGRSGRGWAAFLAGAAGAAVSGCRPVDAVLLLGCAGGLGLLDRLRQPERLAASLLWAAWFAAGIACGTLPTLLLYLGVWGLHESPYLVSSALIGFDPRLLSLHWVELVISPRPLLPGGQGLTQRLPFVGIGLLGLAGALLTGRGDRLRHLLTGTAMLSGIGLYLCYRDLHAPGLWQFNNYHYFKWCFGLLGYYGLLLIRAMVTPGRLRLALFALPPMAILLFCWRVVPVAVGNTRGVVQGDRDLSIAIPPLGVEDALVVPAIGAFDPIYFGTHNLTVGDHLIAPISDFKALPIEGGLLITPLRRWPAGLLSVQVTEPVRLERWPAPFLAKINIRPGLPCWFGWRQPGCEADQLLPPPLIAENEAVSLAGEAVPMFGPGWSFGETGGRWTLGRQAELRFRAEAPADRALSIIVSASPIWHDGMKPATVGMQAGVSPPVQRTLSNGETRDISVCVPPAARTPDGTVDLWFHITPHPPSAVFPPSRDDRPLGLFVRSIRWHETAC